MHYQIQKMTRRDTNTKEKNMYDKMGDKMLLQDIRSQNVEYFNKK